MNKKKKPEDMEYIPPRFLLTLLKPIIRDELTAQCRENREGIIITFPNGQKFLFTVREKE